MFLPLVFGVCGKLQAVLMLRSSRNNVAPVLSLLFSARPIAVCWLVVSVIVAALDRVLWGRLSAHVREKVLELIPALANLYPSPPIVLKGRLLWIQAALSHALPASVFFCAGQAVSDPTGTKPLSFNVPAVRFAVRTRLRHSLYACAPLVITS